MVNIFTDKSTDIVIVCMWLADCFFDEFNFTNCCSAAVLKSSTKLQEGVSLLKV